MENKIEYLYIFGYETPGEAESNRRMATDFESSAMIRILADSEDAALSWGHEISERFLKAIYHDDKISWKEQRFASWIEDKPEEYIRTRWASIPVVKVGEFPGFHLWDTEASEA